MSIPKNGKLASQKNIPLQLAEQFLTRRHYTRSRDLLKYVEWKYQKTGKGITFVNLIEDGLAKHKPQAQLMLKNARITQALFTLSDHRPQKYYPTPLRSEIIKKKFSKNIPIEVTGLSHCKRHNECTYDVVVRQTLEDYVLPLLPSSTSFIHKLQLETKIDLECYNELPFGIEKINKAKKSGDIIGNNHVTFLFYPNATVLISVENSNNPLKLENEEDRSYILTYFGQIRDRLILIVNDLHERLVPSVLEWNMKQCDINKDILIADWLQITGLKIQLKHLDHLFRLYIKSMGKDTVLRVEESKNRINKAVVEALTDIYNPNEKTDKLLVRILKEIMGMKNSFANESHNNSNKCDLHHRNEIN